MSLDPLHHAREPIAAATQDVRDELVLVLAPTGRDGPLACNVLHERAGLTTLTCADVADLCRQIGRGAGAVIIAEEALDVWSARRLIDTLAAQLPWSDLPVIILASSQEQMSNGGNGVPLAVLRQRGNVTVLDRPLRIVTLVTTVQAALRARRRQYEVRDLLAETRNAVRQRDQFLAMLGHELRNPLATITNAMSVLDAASPPDGLLETEQREIIRRQTEHLARLVDDLLDVSRITSGKIALQRRPTDLCELAQRAAKAVDGAARKQRHEVIVTTHCEPVFIDADPVRLEQVVNNLLTNAIKYTPAGGRIDVTVAPDDGARRAARARQRHRHHAGAAPARVRPVRAGGARPRPLAGRAGHRADAGARAGRDARRPRDRAERRARARERVRHHAAAHHARRRSTTPARKPVQPVDRRQGQAHPRHRGPGRRARALQRLLQIWGHEVDVAEDGVRGVDAATHQAARDRAGRRRPARPRRLRSRAPPAARRWASRSA